MADKKIKYDINEAEQPFMSADDFTGEAEEDVSEERSEVFISRLAGLVQEKFESAERGRQDDEGRWLNSYHNYRGIYNKNINIMPDYKIIINACNDNTYAITYNKLTDTHAYIL